MKQAVLSKANILLDIDAMDQQQSIILAGSVLVKNGYVNQSYINAMLEREKISCSYIGNQVAIPHGIHQSDTAINYSGIVVLQSKQGIDYEGNLVHIIIGIAGKDGQHLDILSNIAIKIADQENVNKMINANSVDDIYAVLTQE